MKTTLRSRALVCAGYFYALLGLLPLVASAQIPTGGVNIQSPTVGALQSSFSSGVAPYTGAATVSLPIYTLSEGPVQLPISLRYAGAGFRPDDVPGWTGMGWNLDVGGTITRSVNDLPDELTMELPPVPQSGTPTYDHIMALGPYNNGPSQSPLKWAGWYWFTNWPGDRQQACDTQNPDLEKLAEMNDIVLPESLRLNSYTAQTAPIIPGLGNVLDTEADEFSFNVQGYSGKFYFNVRAADAPCTSIYDGTDACHWMVRCNRPVRIELIKPTPSSSSPTQLMRLGLLDVPFTQTLPIHSLSTTRNRSADANYPAMFRGFILTTETGVRYTFGGNTDAIEYTIPKYDWQDDYWTATAWHLTKIEYPTRHSVEFYYKNLNQLGYRVTEQFFYTGRKELLTTPTNPNNDVVFEPHPWQNCDARLIRPCVLDSLVVGGSNTSVRFDSELSPHHPYSGSNFENRGDAELAIKTRKGLTQLPPLPNGCIPLSAHYLLKNIGVRVYMRVPTGASKQKYFAKRFALRYIPSYNPTTQEADRPQLGSVREVIPGDTVTQPLYRFKYYPNPLPNSDGRLPPYCTGQVDHWGFFNNASAPDWVTPSNIYNSRKPLPPSSTAIASMGMLRQIISATGEQTDLTYEQHQYGLIYNQVHDRSQHINTPLTTQLGNDDDVHAVSGVAGGVRLHTVTKRSLLGTESQPTTITYSYNRPDNTGSSGVLTGEVIYDYNNYTCRIPAPTTADQSYQPWAQNVTLSAISLHTMLPTLNGSGAHIGYTNITETYQDGARKETRYANYDTPNGGDNNSAQTLGSVTPYGPFRVRDMNRGMPLQEQWYAAPVGGVPGRLTRKREITYGYYNGTNDPGNYGMQGFRITTHMYPGIASNANVRLLEGISYGIPTQELYPEREVTTQYEADGSSTNTEHWYSYNDQYILKRDSLTNDGTGASQSINTRTSTYYFNRPVVQEISEMNRGQQWSLPLEVFTRRNGKVIGATRYSYQAGQPTAEYRLAIKEPMISVVPRDPTDPFGIAPAGWVAQTQVGHDTYFNPTIVTDNGLYLTSMKWGYHGRLPVAKASGVRVGIHYAFDNFENIDRMGNHWWRRSTLAPWELWPLNSEDAHTGKYSYEFGNTPSRPAPDSTSGPAQRPNIPGCTVTWELDNDVVLPPNVPNPNTLIMELASLSNPFWELETGISFPFREYETKPLTLSYWAKSTAADSYIAVWSHHCRTPPRVIRTTGDGWRYYSMEISAGAAYQNQQILLGGKNVLLDDLRLVPYGISLTTYTHQPHVGITSISDENNQPTYFDYDGFGRLKAVYDADGNLLSAHEYKLTNPE